MNYPKDLTGLTINEWYIIGQEPTTTKNSKWLCRCSCGVEKVIDRPNLVRKLSKSCGHDRKNALKHGMTSTSTYKIWCKMKERTSNPNAINYPRYGGLGIKVCNRWQNSFEAFLEDMGERPEGLSLDRINPYGNYEPSNCRWATTLEQRHNRRSNYDSQS